MLYYHKTLTELFKTIKSAESTLAKINGLKSLMAKIIVHQANVLSRCCLCSVQLCVLALLIRIKFILLILYLNFKLFMFLFIGLLIFSIWNCCYHIMSIWNCFVSNLSFCSFLIFSKIVNKEAMLPVHLDMNLR